MTLPAIVTEATVQSFALMFVVLSAFFIYFCAIFWAFHNPRLTEQTEEGRRGAPKRQASPGCPPGDREHRCAFSLIQEGSQTAPCAVPV